ncbi:MAG: HAD-IA family hydrolase [Pseudomonadota bacterium]
MIHPGRALQCVVFDLDGTLVDTADDFVPAVQKLREEYGHGPMDANAIRASVSNGSRALVTLSLGIQRDEKGFEDARLRLLDLYDEVLGRFATPYAGVPALLRELEIQGIRWGVATNKPRAYAAPLLKMLKLETDSLVCPDDVAQAKPHPESLFKACADLNSEPRRSIYIGDHLRDIEAGQRAGMYTVAAAYGYIEAGDCADRWGADIIITDSEQLADAILNEEGIPS